MAIVNPSLFTGLINQFGSAVSFHVDSYYEDEARRWDTKAWFEDADMDYRSGAPEANTVLTVPVPPQDFVITPGMKVTSSKGVSYEVVDTRPLHILTDDVMWWNVGVKS